jgi:hypothetical protein
MDTIAKSQKPKLLVSYLETQLCKVQESTVQTVMSLAALQGMHTLYPKEPEFTFIQICTEGSFRDKTENPGAELNASYLTSV